MCLQDILQLLEQRPDVPWGVHLRIHTQQLLEASLKLLDSAYSREKLYRPVWISMEGLQTTDTTKVCSFYQHEFLIHNNCASISTDFTQKSEFHIYIYIYIMVPPSGVSWTGLLVNKLVYRLSNVNWKLDTSTLDEQTVQALSTVRYVWIVLLFYCLFLIYVDGLNSPGKFQEPAKHPNMGFCTVGKWKPMVAQQKGKVHQVFY